MFKEKLKTGWQQGLAHGYAPTLAIFILALLVRLAFVWQWHKTPFGDLLLLDAQAYDKWAQDIANGEWLRSKAFYQSPLYPYFLSIFYMIFGRSLILASLLNSILNAATCALLSRFSYRVFGLSTAVITGLFAVFYRPFIFFSAPVMKESLGLFLLTLFLINAFQALEKQKERDFLLSGLWLGLSAMVRSNFLLLGLTLLILNWLQKRKKSTRTSLLFLTTIFITILPATLHNAWASHDFVPISYGGGFNFYIGNSPGANGANIYPPGISSDPMKGEERDVTLAAQEAEGQTLRPSEISHHWLKRGFDYLIENPSEVIILTVNKFWLFWNNYERADNYDTNFIANNFDTLLSWPLINFGFISVLAMFSVVALWNTNKPKTRWLFSFAVTYMLSVMLFYITDRYRLPVVIFLLPLAGASLQAVKQFIDQKNWSPLFGALNVSALFIWLALSLIGGGPTVMAHNWGLLSSLQADAGKDAEAMISLQKGLALAPQHVGSNAIIQAALVAERRGDRREEERLIKLALDLFPSEGVVHYNYGRLAALEGDLNAARTGFEQATRITPWRPLYYFSLAIVYDRLGQKENAIETIKRGLAAEPSDIDLKQALEDLRAGRPMKENTQKQ